MAGFNYYSGNAAFPPNYNPYTSMPSPPPPPHPPTSRASPTADEDAVAQLLDPESGLQDDDSNPYNNSKGSKLSNMKKIGKKFVARIHLGFAVTVEGVKLVYSKPEDEGVKKHLRKLGRRLRRKGSGKKDGEFGSEELEGEQEVWLQEEQVRIMKGGKEEESEGSEGEWEGELDRELFGSDGESEGEKDEGVEEELEKELFGGEEEEGEDLLEMFGEAGFDVSNPPLPQQASTAGLKRKRGGGAAATTMQQPAGARATMPNEKAK